MSSNTNPIMLSMEYIALLQHTLPLFQADVDDMVKTFRKQVGAENAHLIPDFTTSDIMEFIQCYNKGQKKYKDITFPAAFTTDEDTTIVMKTSLYALLKNYLEVKVDCDSPEVICPVRKKKIKCEKYWKC